MTFSKKQLEALSAPLDPRHVKMRKQGGRPVYYIEAWWAISEANRIFGFDGWDRETIEVRQVTPDGLKNKNGNFVVGYTAKVRVIVRAGDTIIKREGDGYGEGISTNIGQAHESAVKEAESDAMKRALMTFGNPFGLALYDKEQKDVRHVPTADEARAIADKAMEQIEAAQDLEALKLVFSAFWRNNKGAMLEDELKRVTEAKDKRKAALEKAAQPDTSEGEYTAADYMRAG